MPKPTPTQTTEEIVRNFTNQFWQDLCRKAGQMVPGADMDLDAKLPADAWSNPFRYMMEPQEWLEMARYGAGEIDGDPAYIYEICQGLAEWLFSIPVSSQYEIPAYWYETDMGALWASAFIRSQGDELITITEAAELAGVSQQAISARIDRGTLRSYVDPNEPNPQRGRRKVRKSDIVRI